MTSSKWIVVTYVDDEELDARRIEADEEVDFEENKAAPCSQTYIGIKEQLIEDGIVLVDQARDAILAILSMLNENYFGEETALPILKTLFHIWRQE